MDDKKEYVEREPLIEWIEKVDGIIADGTVEAPTLYAQMITDIKQFPTADVVEVRHAHWIEDEREATCSDCKCRTFNWAAWSFDWCPFCGAKMDGKGEG